MFDEKYEIKNSGNSSIGVVSYKELMELKKQGVIRTDDKIYDYYTGERVH